MGNCEHINLSLSLIYIYIHTHMYIISTYHVLELFKHLSLDAVDLDTDAGAVGAEEEGEKSAPVFRHASACSCWH